MQRKLSSFDIHVIVHDLQQIINSPLDKSYQLTDNEILIKIKNIATNKKESLFIRNGHFIALTEKQIQTPKTPSNFVMALRKYIQNGRILRIYQHEFDRIIKIDIGKKDGIYTLVIEFFSEGNIILTDPNGNIIIPFISQTWAHRHVKGRQPYIPPPSQINPFTLTLSQFKEIIKESHADIVRTLAVKLNLSGPIAEEICLKSQIPKKKETSQLQENELNDLFSTLTTFLTIFEQQSYKPVLIKNKETIIDILPIPFQSYDQYTMIPIDSFTRGLSKFIETKETIIKQQKSVTKTDETIGKLQRIIQQQQEKIKELDQQITQKKRQGEIIYLHYNKIDELLKKIQESFKEKDKKQTIESLNALAYVKQYNPSKKRLILSLPDPHKTLVDVPLQIRKTVSENAEHAYNESKKYQKKKHGAEKSLDNTKEKLHQIQQEKQQDQFKQKEQQQSRFIKEKRKQFWFERYRWTISSEGNLIIGGKDAKSNEQIVKKHLEKHDRYVHADIHGAPSCIVKRKTWDDKQIEISENTLEEACVFAASYSRAWKQFAEAQSYWVLPQQVSKTPQSGEFVPKGAFIIRGKRHYCKCILEIGIGQITLGEEKRWIGGSVPSIKKWCHPYIIIQPGGMSRKDFSQKITKETEIHSDDINQILPPGGITITDVKGIHMPDKGDR